MLMMRPAWVSAEKPIRRTESRQTADAGIALPVHSRHRDSIFGMFRMQIAVIKTHEGSMFYAALVRKTG
ncbi:hypothetical protein HMPREF0663_11008 [Hoylesella oralis ATCC 33269]|uniref:Uncharacterized protein n=1 Tax=Hoylesella oralis ATCC 33269 TaxID=873533 RepID=E7RPA7_9BACT|nr:hypothetical protein HMPREF0663_11008 [Hoylesella oralis ATCC 33269]